MQTTILTVAEIDPLLERVRAAAGRTTQAIGRLISSEPDGVEVLRQMKFTEMAWHPIDDRPLNLIEQLNQTWTYLVTLKALVFLFERHPAAGGFRLNLGTPAERTSKAWPQGLSRQKSSPLCIRRTTRSWRKT